jgi:hypothetical protein
MPEFLHESREAKDLFAALADEMRIPEAMVEKDYWIMHCLWGLQRNGFQFEMKGGTSLSKGWKCIDRFSEDIDIRFEPTKGLSLRGDSKSAISSRFAFYDDLSKRIRIPGIKVERNRDFDDEQARNGGISLIYNSHFSALAGLRQHVLLEVGFAHTAPNEPQEFSSWAYDRAAQAGLKIKDNRAERVPCFNPEYTFVEKLQTICRRYRLCLERKDSLRDQPRQFLRHYYDLFRLLELERVQKFIGTVEYAACKKDRVRGKDAETFQSRAAFMFINADIYAYFEREYESMQSLLYRPGPGFESIVARLRKYSDRL